MAYCSPSRRGYARSCGCWRYYDDFMPSNYDAVDRAIVEALQRDGRLANVDLADRVGLSPSACLRRTKTLESDGVIAGYHADVDPAAVGLGLRMFISLRVDQHSRANSRRIEESVVAIPQVIACHIVSGDADFLVEALVPDLTAYEGLLLDQILAIGPVTDARTMFAIRTVKTGGDVPLDQWVSAPSGRRAASRDR